MTDEPLITNPDPTTTASAEELRRLPRRARLAMVERIRIVYPRWQHLVREIRSCHEMAEIAAEPPCLLLVGPAGAGKTTLAQWYVNQYARTITPTHTIIPTLYVVIPSKATERNLSMAILHALGDPRYDKGTIGNMQIRVVNYMRDCRVQLLVLDELQHFVDRNSQKVLQDVSNWLKTVIKDQALHIGCVLIG
jgi:Cdc6-like AAA superfamily ATPase